MKTTSLNTSNVIFQSSNNTPNKAPSKGRGKLDTKLDRVILCSTLATMICLVSACNRESSTTEVAVNGANTASPVQGAEVDGTKTSSPANFIDRAAASGIRFEHFLGATGKLYFPEIIAGGVALFDYDNDGDLDLYVTQGQMLEPNKDATQSIFPWQQSEPPSNRLFRNNLSAGGMLSFTDVTAEAGVADQGYGMGVAVGDTDNDGDADLLVTNYGNNVFYRNNGDGTFTHLADAFAIDDEEEWATSASFVDFDSDGDLDLFYTNYVGFTVANNVDCRGTSGRLDYCTPNIYPPTVDRLWRNEGSNHFVEVTRQSGIDAAAGSGLGTSTADFDGDGDVDIYVANDMQANRLWIQDTPGHFIDQALMAGTAYNANGKPEASMGVSAGDFDGDGDDDLFMTHLTAETNTLYLNDGSGNFVDQTDATNLGASSLRLTGFGTAWFDYDNDGWLDLFIANGAVLALDTHEVDAEFPYGQRNQLFRNRYEDGGGFDDLSTRAGEALQLNDTSRGAAFGDIDNDGDIDIAVANANGPLRLLLNQTATENESLSVKLIGVRSPKDGTGSRLKIELDDGRSIWRRAHTDGSYLSASDSRIHIGLAKNSTVRAIEVRWTSGEVERWSSEELGITSPAATFETIKLVEGSGQKVP